MPAIAPSGGEFDRQPVMTLSDLSRIFINVLVNERKIGGVRLGQNVEINADSYPGRTFSGVVRRISPTGANSGDAVTFGVQIEVTSPDKAILKPPMTAHVRIIRETADGVLLVPTCAVERNQQSAYVTVVAPDGRQQDRPVKVGLTDGANDEILGGLTVGDRVLVRAANTAVEVAQNANE